MQTIQLTKNLTEIPIPENLDDVLLIKDPRRFYPEVFRPIPYLDGSCFNTVISDYENAKYEVVKVTAAETPQFKVGDRVKWANGNGLIIDVVEAYKLAEILWNKNGVTVVVLIYFKDLTLISNFKVGDKVLYKAQQGYTIHRIDTNTNTCWLIQPIIRVMLQANLTDLTLAPNETT